MAKFCGKCGNQLEDTANVCDQCGTPVNTNATSSVQVNQTIVNSSKNNGFAVAGFVISLVSIFMLWWNINFRFNFFYNWFNYS